MTEEIEEKVVLTEADSLADLMGTPRPDNPSKLDEVPALVESPIAQLKRDYHEEQSAPPKSISTDKDDIEQALMYVLNAISTLRDTSVHAGDQVLSKRLTNFGKAVSDLRGNYIASIYPKL